MPYDNKRDIYAARNEPFTPARRAVALTPDDSNDLVNYAKALYVGVAGDITVLPTENTDGQWVTFKNRPVGDFPISVRRLRATGTTAQEIVAYLS